MSRARPDSHPPADRRAETEPAPGAGTERAEVAAPRGRAQLRRAVTRGVRDNMIAEILAQAVRVGGLMVLARALRPEDFGLLRVLLVITVFAALASEAGVPDAFVQRKQVTDEHEAAAWWLGLGLAVSAAALLYAAAPALAALMKMPRLCEGARLLCLPIVLEGSAVAAGARLRRRLSFGALAAADVAAEVAFLITAMVLLWRGLPMWSLPGALAARLATHALALWVADPQLPRALPSGPAIGDFAPFAATVSGGRLMNLLSANADYLLVGRLLGDGALGFYSMAWDLLRFVPDRLHRVAGQVAFPAFCRIQDDRAGLARAYSEFFDYTGLIVLPIAVVGALAAPEILQTLYGPQWTPAVTPMRLLAAGLALRGMRLGIGAVYFSRNRPAFDIYLHGVRFALIVAAVWGCARWGLFGVSAGMSVAEGVVSVMGVALACTLLEIPAGALVRAAAPAVWLAVLCGLCTFAGRAAAMAAGWHGVPLLAAAALPAAIAWAWMERARIAAMFAQGSACASEPPLARAAHPVVGLR
ncbi:MAG TPA: oligosaccharide flippase family protein [Candidatus Binataceae bacterium]|nr:oligosaccharide flippase family protein [Candidatus Binataceae bacterium]